jgi:DNA (cytosine-5)-methyltransferase 1
VGFKIIGAIEIDKWAAETFKKINPETIVICNDIQNISDSELKKTFNSPDVLIGSPPCEGSKSM